MISLTANVKGSYSLETSKFKCPKHKGGVKVAWAKKDRHLDVPDHPTHVSDVHVPVGTRVRVGKVAPQEGWGTGGAYQYELLQRLRESAFRNTRPLQ